ncbi:MAG TPA: phosphatase PAP2 family protein [Polyangiaceae bacterium]|jgi:hypothetical protein|nr:phosphatase PAP2 family protein [Polyangiaceae bacterium]
MIRAWCERIGLLGLLSALALVLGIALQHALHLPARYDWGFPYRVLWRDMLSAPGFPCAMFGVALAGWVSSGVSLRALLPASLRARLLLLLFGLAIALLDALLFEQHAPWDWLASGLLGACSVALALAEPNARGGFARLAGSLVYVTAVFAAISFFYTVVKASLFLHASPHDASLIALVTKIFGVPPHRVIANFAATRPRLVACCDWIYFRLFQHMILVGILLTARRDARERAEYCAALGVCYLLGAPLYHLFPAWGPGYFEPQYFAYLDNQKLTTAGVRFWLWQNTREIARGTATELYTWSYIACMPSLHIAHECVMAYYGRRPSLILVLSICFTLATLLAVVVLGWHYPADWISGVALAAVSIFIARRLRELWWPRTLLQPGRY